MITLACEHRFNGYLLRYKMTYIKIPDSDSLFFELFDSGLCGMTYIDVFAYNNVVYRTPNGLKSLPTDLSESLVNRIFNKLDSELAELKISLGYPVS